MKIHHIALCVTDLEKMKSFYKTYFGAEAGEMYHNPKSGLKTYFLRFPDGGLMELMTLPDVAEYPKDQPMAGYIHLAFDMGSKEEVDRQTALLQDGGYMVQSGPRVTGDGYYESCVLDPEGNRIELLS